MVIRSFFGSSSKAASSTSNISSSEAEFEEEIEVIPSKTPSTSSPTLPKKRTSSTPDSSTRKYHKTWEEDYPWLQYDADAEGAFCKICKVSGRSVQQAGGVWTTKPFTNWKNAAAQMKAHAKSDGHIMASQVVLATQGGSIVQQLQKVGTQERMRNRAAIKSLIRCTHFLARQHIAHTTNFSKLVDLVVSCGGEDLKYFMEKTGRNAMYTSHVAVVEFVQALGTWVEESILKRLQQASHYSIMADECTDITTVEEMSVFCRWEEKGIPEEHFLEIVHLRQANAESIFSALVECLKEKKLQINRIVGMDFDGASTFSGGKTGVQTRMKTLAPHALFVHCHCHLLQLACVQAANSTKGIKHVYATLMALWKYFHCSPKRAESFKAVKSVLDFPELKIAKPSDTRWLAHERCVKAVKASYGAIVVALNNIHETTHEPEALGLSKALSKVSTVASMYMLDYTLPQVAKLSKTLQTEHLDLSIIPSLVDSTLDALDDTVLPAANWVLELLDEAENLEKTADIEVSLEDITTFQANVAKPFIAHLKDNISSLASSSDVSAMSIFDPKKMPSFDSPDLPQYGKTSIGTLLSHYGTDKPSQTLLGNPTVKKALISSEIHTEWITYRRHMAKQPKDNMKSQLEDMVSNDMLATMFPNLHTIAKISLSIPVATASVERSLSQMKLIKTRLRSSLNDTSLSHLMKIAIESPDQLTDGNLDEIVEV